MAVTFPTDLGGNGLTYDNDSFALGGHRINFIPVLEQVVVMAESASDNAVLADDAKDLAVLSANNASISESNAELYKNQASQSATSANNSAMSAEFFAEQASLAREGALNAASLSGAKAFATYNDLQINIQTLTDSQVAFVVTDETRGNQGAYYRAIGTPASSLSFLRLHEHYSSPFSYIQSDSVQNMITKLLVLSGAVPQNPAVLDADFSSSSYLI